MTYQVRTGSFVVVARGPAEAIELYQKLSVAEPNTTVTVSDADGNDIALKVLRAIVKE